MLTETQQRIAVGLAAKYFENPKLTSAVSEAAISNSVQGELNALNRLIATANDIASSKDSFDPDLINLHQLTIGLPTPFAWKDRTERNQWTASFMKTAAILNSEITVGEYKNPREIEDSSIFRFFLLDGYARWVVTNAVENRDLKNDRAQANTVVNALCEAAVVLAERNDPDALDAVTWMNNQKWIEEAWGFDPELVKRAQRFSS